MASNKETAELLMDAGADVNAKTKHTGENPLYAAARNAAQGASKSYDVYLALAKVLIDKGADPNVKLKSGSMIEDNEPHRAKAGETALHAVSRSFSQKHASEVCELLLAYGAKVNEPNAKGQTPLDEALANERNETAETLRNHGGKKAPNQD
jgi:ankyrin repeat protein